MSSKLPNSSRGFASMERERRIALARKAGKVAHANGNAHAFDAAEARSAGAKGGTKVSRDRAHMAAIGRLGGLSRGRRGEDDPGGAA